jgi:hypothetical protein
MTQTRRQFIGTAAAIGGASLLSWPAMAATGPVRVSLDTFSKDAVRVASLRKAVGVMKARLPSDPKSWFFQAAIHAYNDAAYAEALAQDPEVAQVDAARFWNKCPHFGQSSADFLLWHRAYVHNFEHVLRDAAGDPQLALPYWDYSKPENRTFPAIFASAFVDPAGTIPNPLYHPNREQAFVTGRFDLSAAVGEALTTMAAQNFFSDVGTIGFAGDILDSQHTQLGLIEQRPHNDIHIAVGGVVGTANGAMADVPTAAFDPVFWVHHANIDRIWAEWACMQGKGWGPLPPAEWLDEEPWEFIAVDGSITRVSRRFIIERSNLAVIYDTDASHGPSMMLPPAPVQSAAPPTAGVPGGETASPLAPPPPPPPSPQEREILADSTPLQFTSSAPLARTLQPAPVAVGAAPGAEKHAAPAAPTKPKRVLLELSDISFARVPSSGFAIYLLSGSDVTAGRLGSFVGLLDLFGSTHAHMSGMEMMGAAQRFDVTSIVAREGLGLTLRVEPYDLLVSKEGHAAPKRDDVVKVGQVRFVEVP